MHVFCQKKTEEKIVALTFDDGPDPIQTPKILKILNENKIPACFFCIGSKIKGNEALLRQIVQDGHLIGNHSYTHTWNFPLYSHKRMKEDLQSSQLELEQIAEQPITLFRPPFGVTNPTIAKVVRKLGYQTIGWNIRTLDTQHNSPRKILSRIKKRLKPGSIILLHDRLPHSHLILKEVIKLINQEGYTIVSLNKLIK